MDSLVSYEVSDGVATLVMDDGKVNVLSLRMLAAIHEALDQAMADRAAVVLAGRTGVFSAGFDLGTLRAGGPDGVAMGRGGFALAARVLSFPFPVVAACTGHAIAMGAFLLCACDYRIGAAGAYKLTANEVAIGFPGTRSGDRDSAQPAHAVGAQPRRDAGRGHHARQCRRERLPRPGRGGGVRTRQAQELARTLNQLDQAAHVATKLTVRQSTLDLLARCARIGSGSDRRTEHG